MSDHQQVSDLARAGGIGVNFGSLEILPGIGRANTRLRNVKGTILVLNFSYGATN
jgi:hypothetical protein